MSDATPVFQVHLNLSHCSMRGVRYRMLTAAEQRKIQGDVFRMLPRDATAADARLEEVRRGISAMIVAVTEPLADLGGATWKTVTRQDLEMPSSDCFFDKLFPGPKDDALLSSLYSDLHEIRQGELEAIKGKVVPVSLG